MLAVSRGALLVTPLSWWPRSGELWEKTSLPAVTADWLCPGTTVECVSRGRARSEASDDDSEAMDAGRGTRCGVWEVIATCRHSTTVFRNALWIQSAVLGES